MKIFSKKTVEQTEIDINLQDEAKVLPTSALPHTIQSDSTEDTNEEGGTAQVETAIANGTISQDGDIVVVITSALVTGSPLSINVAVTNGDLPAAWAAKVKTALNNTTAVTAHYNVSTNSDKIVLRAKVIADNDSTLNIELKNSTSAGIVPAATSVNTTAGTINNGAKKVLVAGIDQRNLLQQEIITIDGQNSINTSNRYKAILYMQVIEVGTAQKNKGAITAIEPEAGTESARIVEGKIRTQEAFYMTTKQKSEKINYFNVAVSNPTAEAVTFISIKTKQQGQPWVDAAIIEIVGTGSKEFVNSGYMPEIEPATMMKVTAIASEDESLVSVNFNIE